MLNSATNGRASNATSQPGSICPRCPPCDPFVSLPAWFEVPYTPYKAYKDQLKRRGELAARGKRRG